MPKEKDPENNKPIEVKDSTASSNVPVSVVHDNYQYPLLKDVYGSEEFKSELESILYNIEYAEMYNMFGVSPNKSYILQGDAGVGKTFSVKAIRNELIQDDHEVAFVPYDIGTYGTAYINMGAKNLQNYFDTATQMQLATPGLKLLLQFDELDSIMSKRGSGQSHKEDDKLLNCLMKNLQDINSYKKDQYFFGMTNFYEALDQASIRSGRIDKIIKVERPETDALQAAYKGYVNKLKDKMQENMDQDVFKRINYKKLAKASEGFNFADVEQVVYNTVRNYATDLIKQSQLIVPVLGQIGEKDLLYEIDKMREQRYKDKGKVGF